MATYEADQILTSSFLSVGDDVYLKPSGTDWQGSPWAGDHIIAAPTAITATSYSVIYSVTAASLDTSKSYVVYQNIYNAAFTADVANDRIDDVGHGLIESTLVYFKGADLPDPLVAGKPYYVAANPNADWFQVSATDGGAVVTITDAGSGTMTYTASSQRTSSDQIVGVIQADSSALVGEGQGSRIEANVATILSTTNTLYNDWIDGGRLDLILDAVLADTNELQTDWTDGGRLDLILDTIASDIVIIDGIVDAIKLKTDLIGTSAALLLTPTSSSLTAQVESTAERSVTCNTDISAKTLVVTFETTPVKTDVATVADGAITKSTTTATFNLPAAATASERTLRYTIKDTTTNEAYASGKLFVTYDALED